MPCTVKMPVAWYISFMLAQDIKIQMIAEMKAKDKLRVDTLRGCMAAFTNELVVKGRNPSEELTEDEAIAFLKRLGKQRTDAVEQYTKGGRAELADKEAAEKKIIEEFLPQMASREDIEKVAKAKIAELGVTDASGLGKLTGAIMKEMAGRADGNDVKAVIQSLLS